tara:strand:+ start:2070 stop:3674 length:1605 start_codon:yes stop_codon:yes gene_type:complete
MVRRGFLRGFGAYLKRIISLGTKNRFISFASGIFVTFFLQSSTATILLISSFAKNGLIAGAAAIAVVIGADVSTTLVARVLVLDLSLLSPILIICGFAFYSEKSGGQRNQISTILIGLGLMLLSLTLLRESITPLTHSETLPFILAPLQNDALVAILAAAVITWLMHSSLAAVLFFASLSTSSAVTLDLGFYLILGANLGGAIIPYVLMLKESNAHVRQITAANLIMRISIILALLPFADLIVGIMQTLGTAPEIALVNLHIAFNILLALIYMPLVSVLAKVTAKIIPDKLHENDDHSPVFLDEKALDTPVIALAGAARETLRMAEFVESMLQETIETFQKNDNTLIKKIRETDDTVDKIYNNIKIYMTNLSREGLDTDEANRYVQILTFSTNLEYVGDIIDKNLMELAEKKIKKHDNFSDEGMAEIVNFHRIVLENMQLAQNIFMLQDTALARQLVEEKKSVRKAVRKSSDKHFQRLTDGKASSLATSSLHLDIIRDLRRINTYMTAVAYNIIEQDKKREKDKKKKKKAQQEI